jgi:VCBS repeat protein/FG-GAP repeat protein
VPVLAAAACFAGTAAAVPPPPAIVTGQDAGWPDVRGWGVAGQPANGWAPWGEFPLAFSPYPTYQNGVRVAVGDVNGDGRPEIVTAPGKSAFTELRVFEGTTYRRLGTVLPFRDASWWSGAFVAVGDTNGDGRAEIVDGLDAGCCTTVHVVDATSGNELSGFFPYGDRSEVGARVAAGDVNGDGKTEIVSALLGSAQVDVFGPSGGTAIRTIDAFGPERIGPVSIAAGDVSGDSRAEIVAAAPTGGGAQVKIFDVTTGKLQASVFPYGGAIVSSLEIALGDVNGDRRVDVITSAVTAAGTQVKAVDTDGHALAAFYVLDPDLVPGASLAAGDLDGDGKAEIVLGAGPTTAPWPPSANGPDQQVAVYRADGTRVGSFGAYPGLFQGGVRVALGDVDRDRFPEIITAPGPGLEPEIGVFSQEWVNGRDRGMRLAHFLAFEPTFLGGVSVAAGDVDGNGKAEIVAAAGPGRPGEVRVFDADGRQESSFLPFGSGYEGGLSVAAGDLNADGRPEIVVGTLTAPARVRAFDNGFPYGATIAPFSPDGPGAEVAVADLSGDGHGQILAAGSAGAHPQLALVDPLAGSVRRTVEPVPSQSDGLRLAAGSHRGRPGRSGGRDRLGRRRARTRARLEAQGGRRLHRVSLPRLGNERRDRSADRPSDCVRAAHCAARGREARSRCGRPIPRCGRRRVAPRIPSGDQLGRPHHLEGRSRVQRRRRVRRSRLEALRASRPVCREGHAYRPRRPQLDRAQHRDREAASATEVVDLERVLAEDAAAGLLSVRAEQFGEDLDERLPPPFGREVVELRSSRGIRRVEQLRDGRELECFAEGVGRTCDVRDRQRQVEVHVAVHVRHPAGLAHEGVAVEQHEARLAEALHERLQIRGIRPPEVEVRVAETAMHLYRERFAGRLVCL